ncbi:MAG: hypothetical protein IJV31_06685 [Clostridia bacterium]|nr:hypothetical protein [Clostridia bacterium]
MKRFIVVLVLLLLFASCTFHEYYYSPQGRCITVIKKWGSKYSWFVMPYKWANREVPKHNFIEIKENSWLRIYWINDSILYIYNEIPIENDIRYKNSNGMDFTEKYIIYDINKNFNYIYDIANPTIDTIITNTNGVYDTSIILNRFGLKDTNIDFLMIDLGTPIH